MIAEVLMGCCSVTTLIAYLPQIVKLLVRKESEDISIASWALWLFESICYVIYALHSKDIIFIVTEVITLICVIAVLTLTIRYRKKH